MALNGTERHHPRKLHELAFYHACIRLLIDGLRAGMSHAQLAKQLNSAKLSAPSGAAWSTGSIKACLHKLKNPDTHPSRMFQALTRLVFVGMLTKQEAEVLTTHRGYSETLL